MICQKWNIYRCLQFGVNSDVLFRENSDVITIKLNIFQKWNIYQEWDFCDILTGNICQEWDICDMPRVEYSLGMVAFVQ